MDKEGERGKKSRWVKRETFTYSEAFKDEAEARRWMEEMDRFFYDVHRRISESMRRFFDEFDRLWMPSWFREGLQERVKPLQYRQLPKDLLDRVLQLEADLKEIKELLTAKYIRKRKEKPKYAT